MKSPLAKGTNTLMLRRYAVEDSALADRGLLFFIRNRNLVLNLSCHPANAAADCAAPIITNVEATNVSHDSATIAWATNEAASSKVEYADNGPAAYSYRESDCDIH